MSTSNLSANEIANIEFSLAFRALEHGNKILGSQLGGLLNTALRPKSVREFGGLRSFVQEELQNKVRLDGQDTASPDLMFTIIGHGERIPIASTLAEVREVAGSELWKIFSNPNVPDKLSANPSGSILRQPPYEELAEGYAPLVCPGREDYRLLAREFAHLQTTEEMRTALDETLNEDDFYKFFIAKLRTLRTPTKNPSKEWEIFRAEFVAKKLLEGLQNCGVDISKSTEIVTLARPVVTRHRPATEQIVIKSSENETLPNIQSESASLRALLHKAIDLMTDSDLRELKIPVGVLIEATRKTQY